MIVNDEVLHELEISAGNKRAEKANDIKSNNNVKITKVNYENSNNFSIHAEVKGKNDTYHTYIEVKNGEIENLNCTCPDYESTYGTCKHILATALEFNSNPSYIQIIKNQTNTIKNTHSKNQNNEKYRIFRQMISSFYLDEQNDVKENLVYSEKVKIEPRLIYKDNLKTFRLEVRIGNKQMYKIKDLTEFYTRMQNAESYKYGAKLEFVHVRENFEEESLPILDFILKYAEIIKYANEAEDRYYTTPLDKAYIVLSNTGLDEFFKILKEKTIEIYGDYSTESVQFVDNEPDIKFELKNKNDTDYVLTTNIDVFNYIIVEGKEYAYFWQDDKMYKCSKDFEKTVIKLLNIFKVNFTKEIILRKDEFADFYSLIMPLIKDKVNINNVDSEELSEYLPKKLKVKVFLDYNKKNYITADLKFIYDDFEFSPFEQVDKKIPRNAVEESKALDMFSKSGFMYDQRNNKLVLVKDDDIFNFLQKGIEEYVSKFEVLATEDFRNKQIMRPKINSIGVKIENNLLSIDLSNIDIDRKEIAEIMRKYKLKKRYHRLKNGEFVDLENSETMDILDKISDSTNASYEELISGELKLPIYRGMYLDKILKKNENIVVKKGESYRQLIDDVYNRQISDKFVLPKGLKANLREYQQVGFDWLKTLDEYKLGGILADDMGLGKTIQLLAVIMSYVENTNEEERKPVLVVCPSSLTLNWKEEASKFTPSLKTVVISGDSKARENIINNTTDYDIVITSYDLLKRDINLYKEKNYNFRYIIADEAQYIKNNNTQNAKVIKEINADTKFALTGTPIENSLSELWSIFDFIMPGYLYSYNKFKILYETPISKDEDKEAMAKLKSMIEPFILRRIKENVLTELPEKTITVLNNEMTGEQLKIYLSYMQSAKRQAKEEIEANGIANSQIKILALLMRLRQICCHPGLFIENYEGESSKLNQCMEIVKDAINGGHKILLFSGYSSMFTYLEREFEKENIKYFKLTGQTKVEDRMDLVNEFNNNDDIKVFLISLKAGGTGLNLIGADMVIHYDPWWNLSAENQATDRTYRIGQKRNVQVYKLITKNSIEEKIYNLQERKAKLAEDMLSMNETFISKLSKDEIMDLFE